MSVNMQVSLGGLLMKNPVTTASGTFASGKEYAQFFDVSRLGAITTKGLSLNGWAGNDTPRIAETPSGMLNSIGLQNPGVAAFVEKDLPWLREVDTQVIVNVSGHSVAEYQGVVEALEAHQCLRDQHLLSECRLRRPYLRHGSQSRSRGGFRMPRANAKAAHREAHAQCHRYHRDRT